MPLSIQKNLLLGLTLLICSTTWASHTVGGDITYTYMGDTLIYPNTYHKYQVVLNVYADCENGQPEAIAEDNPAYIGVYDGTGHNISIDTVFYSSAVSIQPTFTAAGCGLSMITTDSLCLLRKTFIKTYYLLPNATGYVVSYQRCCRNTIANVPAHSSTGSTFTCFIPDPTIINNSPVFRSYPQQVLCLNHPFTCDISAIDPDGDSLSYGFCSALNGADSTNLKPIPLAPPFYPVTYLPYYSATAPFTGSPSVTIDPVTGIMSGQPDRIGSYLIAICCYEWRAGVLIDSVRREFEFHVQDCTGDVYKPFAGNDTVIIVGESVHFHAIGGVNYSWTPATNLDNTAIPDPIGTYPAVGTFRYLVTATSDSGCTGTDDITVRVISYSMIVVPNAFTPNGDGWNDYLEAFPVLGATLLNFKVYNRDGTVLYNGGPGDLPWDGTYRGKKQEMGTYLWKVQYIDNAGVTRTSTGNVTLIR